MSLFRCLRRHLLPLPAPAIARVTASGTVKRQGMVVGIAVVDDGTATSYRYDVQANGSSLTGVTVRDGTSSLTANFPYTTSSNYIQFDCPAALVSQPYTMTGDARVGTGSWAGATLADENFSHPSDLFTPTTRATPTVTRLTASGTTAMQVQIGGMLYEGDNLRIEKFDGTDAMVASSVVAITDPALGSPFTIAIDGSFDPQPEPALGTTTSANYFKFRWESADYQTSPSGDSSGIVSQFATVAVTDGTGNRYWRVEGEVGNPGFFLREFEMATSLGGNNIVPGSIIIYQPSGAEGTTGGFPSANIFDGNIASTGSLVTSGGWPLGFVIDFGITRNVKEVRLKDHVDFNSVAPTIVKVGPCQDASGSYAFISTVVDTTGSPMSWSTTVDDVKTFNGW